MRHYLIMAIWTLVAGAGIPLVGVLNSGLTKSVGNPFAATTIMFVVAMVVALGITLTVYGLPPVSQLVSAPPINYTSGLLIGFYALSATVIIPRFGTASFIAYILIAQLVTSACVDQFGLFGMMRRPIDLPRFIGLAVIVAGIVIMQSGTKWSSR